MSLLHYGPGSHINLVNSTVYESVNELLVTGLFVALWNGNIDLLLITVLLKQQPFSCTIPEHSLQYSNNSFQNALKLNGFNQRAFLAK